MIQHDCDEVFAFPEVPYERADELVPDGYEVAGVDADFDGKPDVASLLITVRRCKDLEVDGAEVPNPIDAYISVPILEPSSPAPHPSFLQPGQHDDAKGDQGLLRLELYIVEWITNNKPQAKWLAQKGLAPKVTIVPNLEYQYNPVGGVDPNFRFVAPAPAASPFRIEALVSEPGGDWDAGINLWADTEEGTLIIFGEHHKGPDQRFGPADGKVVSVASDSPLGRMFGGATERPMNNAVNKAFSSAGFSNGQWTKCLRHSSGDGDCSPEKHVVAPSSGD